MRVLIILDMGDERWRQLLDRHETLSRRQIERFGGRLVKSTGDGILPAFESSAQAIRSSLATREAMRGLDLPLRIGIHTGEVEIRGNDIGRIAVHVAARVIERADTGTIIVSRTVADLVAASGILPGPR